MTKTKAPNERVHRSNNTSLKKKKTGRKGRSRTGLCVLRDVDAAYSVLPQCRQVFTAVCDVTVVPLCRVGGVCSGGQTPPSASRRRRRIPASDRHNNTFPSRRHSAEAPSDGHATDTPQRQRRGATGCRKHPKRPGNRGSQHPGRCQVRGTKPLLDLSVLRSGSCQQQCGAVCGRLCACWRCCVQCVPVPSVRRTRRSAKVCFLRSALCRCGRHTRHVALFALCVVCCVCFVLCRVCVWKLCAVCVVFGVCV